MNKKKIKNKGFALIEIMVIITIIGILITGTISVYIPYVLKIAERTLYNNLTSLKGHLETRTLEEGLIGLNDNDWKKFQQDEFSGRDLYTINDRLSNRIGNIYYKEGNRTSTNEIFCIGFKPITKKYIKMAKKDDGVNDEYLEICNEGRTSIDLGDSTNRMILKSNYIN